MGIKKAGSLEVYPSGYFPPLFSPGAAPLKRNGASRQTFSVKVACPVLNYNFILKQ